MPESVVRRPGRRVLYRYIIRELSLYFAVAFIFFFLIFFVNQILLTAEELLKQRVPVLTVIELLTYSLPFIIAQSAPFATLVGFLMCLGRMMSDNEILIFRATGNHYRAVLKPVLFLALVISLLSFVVNDYLLPLGTIRYNELYREIMSSNPSVVLESNSIKRNDRSTLVIGDVDGNTVSDLILFNGDAGKTQKIIIAGESLIESPQNSDIFMQLEMNDAVAVFFDEDDMLSYDYMESDTLLMNIFSNTTTFQSSGTSPREMTSYDLYKELSRMKREQKTSKRTLNLWNLEFNKKFSLPFASIFFAFLALPLAFLFGKHHGQTVGLIIGIVICFAYWALMMGGQLFSYQNGFNGVITMWLPDVLVGLAAVFLYWSLLRR